MDGGLRRRWAIDGWTDAKGCLYHEGELKKNVDKEAELSLTVYPHIDLINKSLADPACHILQSVAMITTNQHNIHVMVLVQSGTIHHGNTSVRKLPQIYIT